MSKKLFLLPALLVMAAILFTPSCKDDSCDIAQSDFTGQYSVVEDCSSSAPAAYTVTITAGASEFDLKLANVWDSFTNAVDATIDCETITIPRQEPDNDDFFVEGSGTLEKRDNDVIVITISYTVTDETDPANIATDNCTSTVYTKL
ncbi:MAG: hypothetical protein DYG98_10020 [Haliscomenobacteraceae bacterium CHB4]|nr:hypothetical protein [Saprospiraceae bacterium]MCE7923384.1 hypothetical protein [Haliscomenobacteraceae bacterium CHB4]